MNKLIFANSPEVQSKVEYNALILAKNVASESDSTDNHVARVQLAYATMMNGASVLPQLTKLVLTNATIAAAVNVAEDFLDVPDGDIQFELSSIWTMFALARLGS